jgi:hypothetical protein
MIVAFGLAVAVATAGIAVAGGTGASENNAKVVSKITPNKLPKKKFKPVNLFLGVVNSKAHIDGLQSNPASELISSSKNVKIRLSKAPRCSAPLPNGSTPAFAKNACPGKSFLGKGDAEVTAPGGAVIAEPVVSVFNGPGKNEVRLHTYDPRLAGATPTVAGKIVKSKAGAKYGQALQVDDAPDVAGDAGKITAFNAELFKKSKVATARCKAKKFLWRRTVTYDDGSKSTVNHSQPCKVKK